MKKLALFISGSGGNALNLVQACREGRIPAEPILAVASRATASGIDKLRDAGLLVAVVGRNEAGVPGGGSVLDEAYSQVCLGLAEAAEADLILLAGWLHRLVVPPIWEGRILNIHPGPLPRFGGLGMYGLHVHRAVLATGLDRSACTVHLVDNEYDQGRTLATADVPVRPGDTAETLQARVYEAEMALYPKAVTDFIQESR